MKEILHSEHLIHIEKFIEEQLSLLKPVANSWQPSDLLPDMGKEGWHDDVLELRRQSAALSDDLLVVLVGNIVTEEALPSYQTWLNRNHGLEDPTGASLTPWAMWTRGWTAEENRHGEVLNKYLYLTGRVDMRSFEITTHHLLKNGFDLKSGNDPYCSIVYAAFQERATKISHANTGKLADQCGDSTLSKICSAIAGDEARHEEAYKRFYKKIIEIDADVAVMAFATMMRQKISMPALLMSDGVDMNLFENFAVVAQKTGMYTVRDYAEIIEHLLEFWDMGSLTGLSDAGEEAQEYVCKLPARYLRRVELIEEKIHALPKTPFKWIFGRSV